MQPDIDQLSTFLPQLNAEKIQLLRRYYDNLLYFNAKINLVSAATLHVAAKQHFADSVMGLEIAEKQSSMMGDVYDFGSGNGFPGMILAIMRPDLNLHLVERDMRKSEFLKHVSAALHLKNVNVIADGIETLPRGVVTHGVTRALGSISTVLIQVNSLFAKGGTLFHFKADSWSSELASCPTQIFTNWDIRSIGQYCLPESTVDRFIISSVKL